MTINPEKILNLRALPFPHELTELLPLLPSHQQLIACHRQTIRNILTGVDRRLLLIVGPCSIHDIESAIEYATRLKVLAQTLSDSFFIVMRVYFEKPRTALGWKGLLLDPHLDGSNDISTGLFLIRQLLLQLADLGLPAATEILEPSVVHYFGDLISWGCIGARTTESQIHRQLASGLEMPIAFKNNTSGSIQAAVKGMLAACQPHTFMGINREGRLSVIKTEGNPNCHLVLRGGDQKPNYDSFSVGQATGFLQSEGLLRSILIDCSHGNSPNCHSEQLLVFKSVVQQIAAGNKNIRGIILESHLNEGRQPFPTKNTVLKYATSITDPCIGWNTTEELLHWGAQILKNLSLVLILLLVMSSCCPREELFAFSEYITCNQLASYKVGTPDPQPDVLAAGQRIVVRWNIQPGKYVSPNIKLTVRLGDRTEIMELITVDKKYGTYIYSLRNEEYFLHKGIFTYKIELFDEDVLQQKWLHQMWVDLILFQDN